jgi:hypothetical protein
MNTTTHTGRSRRLVLAAAVSVAAISTVGAYLAMVSFGIDVLTMSPATAYATAGVFELSLVTVALLAREAARDARPGGVLLALTWALSSASGVFAAWHELYMGHPAGAAVFRFLVPLLAALMWHLALIGDRHLATGTSWSSMRATARMHALFLTTEDAARAHQGADTTTASQRAVARAEARRRRARAVALRTVPPDEMRARAAAHLDALSAVADAVSDVAAMHAHTNHRVSGLSVSGLSGAVLSGADRGERAARTLAADIADNRHYSFLWCPQNGSAELYQLPTPPGQHMVNRRYTKGSMVVTSNKRISEWAELFGVLIGALPQTTTNDQE